MADVDMLKALLGRIQTTTGPSHDIDADLYAVQEGWDGAAFCQNGEVHRLRLKSWEGDRRTYEVEDGQGIDSHELPMFTDSLDCAVEMVGAVLPNWSLQLGMSEGLKHPVVVMGRSYPTNLRIAVEHRTAPLAVCAALLTALLAQAEAPSTSAGGRDDR